MSTQTLLGSLESAAGQLAQALDDPVPSDLIRAGCIQYFEFCFELAWKSIEAKAREAGQTDCLSPMTALKQALANGWIADEELWLDMLEARNRMAHFDSAGEALAIYGRLARFLPALQGLVGKLRGA